jgi:hypothetical protein
VSSYDVYSLGEDTASVAAPVRSAMAELTPRKSLPPLLLKLNEVKPERLDYLGVSFGATSPLFKFWKKCGFVPVYMRQTQVWPFSSLDRPFLSGWMPLSARVDCIQTIDLFES